MAKNPVMGRVKTRLARQIGAAGATRFFRATVAAVVGRLARDPRFELTIAVAPDVMISTGALPAGTRRCAQGGGNLGQRMQRLFDRAGRGPVIVIGTDIPCIRPDTIAMAFRLLGRHDAVFGPAEDGGFWLVGMKRRPRIQRPFADVRWSAPETLSDTLANLSGDRVALVATLGDVDSERDLRRFANSIGRRILPAISDA